MKCSIIKPHFSGTKGTSYQTQQYLGYGAPHEAQAPPYATALPPPSLVRAAPQAPPPPPPPLQPASTYYSQSAGDLYFFLYYYHASNLKATFKNDIFNYFEMLKIDAR